MKALFISAALMFLYAQAAFASCGTFEVSKGDVKVQPASGKAVPATVGSKICAGDTVIAADSARAKIKMEDGNELNISPNSKIVIETYQYDESQNKKKVMLNVLRGKVRATTRQENMYTDKAKDGQANTFQVRTKSAVAGVRGTDFLTSFDARSQKTEVITFRGKVEVGQMGPGGAILKSVFVAVGQKTEVVGRNAPSVPKALPAAELMKQNNETHNETPASATAPAASTGPNGKRDRDPASSPSTGGGPSMAGPDDLPGSPNSTAPMPLPPPLPPAPPVNPSQVLNNNILINNAIRNPKSNVIINVRVRN